MSQVLSIQPPTQSRRATSSTDGTLVDRPTQKVLIERDRQGVTVEGFRTLGLASTFIAGVESQCLGLVSGVSEHPKLSEATSALLLIGLSLSVLGAALSLLSARWFDLLRGNELVMLDYRWECAKKGRKCGDVEKQSGRESTDLEDKIPLEIQQEIRNFRWNRRDSLVAMAVAAAVPIVFCGFLAFVVGMVLYTWVTHTLITAIANTVVATLGTFFLVCMHLPFEVMTTLQIMSFERITLPV